MKQFSLAILLTWICLCFWQSAVLSVTVAVRHDDLNSNLNLSNSSKNVNANNVNVIKKTLEVFL